LGVYHHAVLLRLFKVALLLLVLCVCGVAVAAAVIAYGDYSEAHWTPDGRWIGLALYTCLVFGTALHLLRRQWGQGRFWLMTTGALMLHLAAYSVLLLSVDEWRLIWFAPLSLAEGLLLTAFLENTAPVPRARRNKTGKREETSSSSQTI
jgi:hypothetical protein